MSKKEIDYDGTYRIEVTAEDIACAVPGDPANCAIAMAARRLYPELTYLAVSKNRVAMTDRVHRKRIEIKTTAHMMRGEALFDALPDLVRPEDFGPGGVVLLNFKEAKIEDIGFTPAIKEQQNTRRKATREGLRVPKRKVPEDELVARRRIRRLA